MIPNEVTKMIPCPNCPGTMYHLPSPVNLVSRCPECGTIHTTIVY